MLIYVHRDHKDYYGRGNRVQKGTLTETSLPALQFSSMLIYAHRDGKDC